MGDETAWGQMGKGHECQREKAKGAALGQQRGDRTMGRCRAQAWGQLGTVTVEVVGQLEGQGLLAKSLCGEPKALHGNGKTGIWQHFQSRTKASGNLGPGRGF